jgi:RsiW-degrading membrane proteinase PrsW (M82 family)
MQRRTSAVRRYAGAIVAGALGLLVVVWTVVAEADVPPAAFVVAAGAAPAAVLLAVGARLRRPPPAGSIVGGAVVGPLVALLGHGVVAAFAAAFFLGFAASGRALLEELRVDPSVADVLASPWVLLLLVEYSVATPLVEELGKALGAWPAKATDRRGALLAGVAAGAGFAAIENVLYAVAAALFGGPWPAIVAARSLGAAVHPLASGLVVLGWWDARRGGGGARVLARGFLSGAAVHAIWNGAVVALFVVREAGIVPASAGGTLAFAALLGVAALLWLWSAVRAVAGAADPLSAVRPADARVLAAWIVLTAATLVPVAFVILAFPSFYRG